MDQQERLAEHEAKVRALYVERPGLLRKSKTPEERKRVEEYIAVQEEMLALAYDADRCERQLKFCDTETQRGSDQHAEYMRMVESARARLDKLEPEYERLKVDLGIV